MLLLAHVVVGGLTVLFAAASVRALLVHRQPTMDRVTAGRVAASLNRGELPPDEPVRSAARLVAKARLQGFWGSLMMLGVAVSALLLSRQGGPIPFFAYWVLAGFCLLAAVPSAYLAVAARRALASQPGT